MASPPDPGNVAPPQRSAVEEPPSERHNHVLLVLVVLVTAALGYREISRIQGHIGDEYAGFPQMEAFVHGNFQVRDDLAVPPTYHLLVAGIASHFRVDSRDALRLISLLLCLPAVFFFWAAARRLDSDSADRKTYQFLFFPILLPYCFILYTNPLALTLLLLAVWLVLCGRPAWAGLAALPSVAVRQELAVWMLFLLVWIYLRDEGFRFRAASLGRHLLRCWTFCLGLAAVAVFVVVNRGFTLGRHEAIHPTGQVHLGNVWFTLLLCFLLLLPLHLANLPRVGGLLRRQPLLLLGLAALFALYVLTFTNDHVNNQLPEFLHNQLLFLVFASPWVKALFFLPIGYAILSLAATPLQQPACYPFYVFWVLSLLPIWMIEQRYALPGFVLLLLFRVPGSRWVEAALIGSFAALSALFLWGISRAQFFL
jgi:alpha-1,2-glucosyltransferase